jgi:hypothetical protein
MSMMNRQLYLDLKPPNPHKGGLRLRCTSLLLYLWVLQGLCEQVLDSVRILGGAMRVDTHRPVHHCNMTSLLRHSTSPCTTET